MTNPIRLLLLTLAWGRLAVNLLAWAFLLALLSLLVVAAAH